jgi:hypothetical protein
VVLVQHVKRYERYCFSLTTVSTTYHYQYITVACYEIRFRKAPTLPSGVQYLVQLLQNYSHPTTIRSLTVLVVNPWCVPVIATVRAVEIGKTPSLINGTGATAKANELVECDRCRDKGNRPLGLNCAEQRF